MLLQSITATISNICHRPFSQFSQAQSVQNKTLEELLKNAIRTIYAKDNGFADILARHKNNKSATNDLSNIYRKALPLTKYSNYENYVERMLQGEDNVLIDGKVGRFATTGGTTGNLCFNLTIFENIYKKCK